MTLWTYRKKIYRMYIKQIDSKSERQNCMFLLIYIWFIVMKWKITSLIKFNWDTEKSFILMISHFYFFLIYFKILITYSSEHIILPFDSIFFIFFIYSICIYICVCVRMCVCICVHIACIALYVEENSSFPPSKMWATMIEFMSSAGKITTCWPISSVIYYLKLSYEFFQICVQTSIWTFMHMSMIYLFIYLVS